MKVPRLSLLSWRWLVSPKRGLAFAAAGALITVGVMTHSGVSAEDFRYLQNFRIGPSVAQEAESLRAAGIEGNVHIPAGRLPNPTDRPARYGPYLLIPEGWIGAVEESRLIDDPPPLPGHGEPSHTLAELQSSELWREPALPDGFSMSGAGTQALGFDIVQKFVRPAAEGGGVSGTIEVTVWRPPSRPIRVTSFAAGPASMSLSTTTIDDMPALLWEAPAELPGFGVHVRAFDDASGTEYGIRAFGITVDDAISIVRSLTK